MSAETEMFIAFLITDAMVFGPIILTGIVGYIITKRKIKQIDRELEDLNK